MAPFAKVRIEVTSDLVVDLLDHIPLVERKRMARSERWDADGLLRNVSPRDLLDNFVGELAQAVKPASSFFSAWKKDVCGYWCKETACRQTYSTLTPAGRVAEVVVDSSVVDLGHADVISSESGYRMQNSGLSILNSSICKSDANGLETDLMSSRFGIQVKLCPLEAAMMSSFDSLCHETFNVSIDCDTNGGDINPSAKSSCSCRFASSDGGIFHDSSKKDSAEIIHEAKAGYIQVGPVSEKICNGTTEADKKHASTVSPDNLNAPDNEKFSTVASVLPDSRSDLDNISSNDIILPQKPESIGIAKDPAVSDVKTSIVGQRQLLHDADSSTSSHLLSNIHTAIKCQPIEECSNTSQVDGTRNMDASTSCFQEKMLETHTASSTSLHSINGVKHNHSEVPTLPEYQGNIRCAPLSPHSEVEVPFPGKRQPSSDNCNPEIFIKVEASDIDIGGAKSNNPVKHLVAPESTNFLAEIKAEPLETVFVSPENSEPVLSCHNAKGMCVKMESINEHLEDTFGHISLKERMKMLLSSSNSSFDCTSRTKSSKHPERCSSSFCPATSENASEKYSGRSRKRKKTATGSVETALEEDAPELLQILVAHGTNLEEMKLYGSMEDEDMIDISSGEDGFEDLENVISKLFFQPSNSLLNLASSRDTRGSKTTYCLSCLVSLVEQTQYLKLRNFPVQWGWCRDLQSFIFVFEKHNRIVLERPEYGYATYFFELVDSLPICWQITRLVTALKAINCCRTTIVENKSLMVGRDLSEGEARVLEEYGWKPNSGLGSLLNFCDRVVHDRRNEFNSEWKAKIGKLLMSGYEGGRLGVDHLPKRAEEHKRDSYTTLKFET